MQIDGSPTRLAPFNPTCSQAQHTAISMLQLEDDDVLFDVGCGDARLLVQAASAVENLRCVGIEMDPVLVSRANASISALDPGVASRIEVRLGDALDEETLHAQPIGLPQATAVFVYLLPKGLQLVKPILEETARKGTTGKKLRVVSYMFSIRGWEPVVVDRTTKGDCALYLYEYGKSFT